MPSFASCARSLPRKSPRSNVSAKTPLVAPAAGLTTSRTTMPISAGSPDKLVALMPNARALPIPDRDHMIAVGDKVFKAGVLEFLGQHS